MTVPLVFLSGIPQTVDALSNPAPPQASHSYPLHRNGRKEKREREQFRTLLAVTTLLYSNRGLPEAVLLVRPSFLPRKVVAFILCVPKRCAPQKCSPRLSFEDPSNRRHMQLSSLPSPKEREDKEEYRMLIATALHPAASRSRSAGTPLPFCIFFRARAATSRASRALNIPWCHFLCYHCRLCHIRRVADTVSADLCVLRDIGILFLRTRRSVMVLVSGGASGCSSVILLVCSFLALIPFMPARVSSFTTIVRSFSLNRDVSRPQHHSFRCYYR